MEVKSVLLPLGETLMIEIKHQKTGKVLFNVHADTLKGADLAGANLSGADLMWANLTDANLSGANLTGADLRGAIGLSIETNASKSRDELVQDLLDAIDNCVGVCIDEEWRKVNEARKALQ